MSSDEKCSVCGGQNTENVSVRGDTIVTCGSYPLYLEQWLLRIRKTEYLCIACFVPQLSPVGILSTSNLPYELVRMCVTAPLPLRVTIDCSGSDERSSFGGSSLRASTNLFSNRRFDVNSFCNLIHNAIPKAVEDGKFILLESDVDQTGFSDTPVPISVAPPEGFIPKLSLTKWKRPKLKVPTMKVPTLKSQPDTFFTKPRLGIPLPILGDPEEESSVEKMEKIKKGIQKLLHVVKVLGQIDQYLSERTRIVVDKISKTLAE